MTQGLSYTQARDAYKKNLTTKQALKAAQNNELTTLESKIKSDPRWSKLHTKEEQYNTKRTREMAAFLHAGLDWIKAGFAQDNGLTVDQALRMQEMLIKRNGPNNNSYQDEIIAQIKADRTS